MANTTACFYIIYKAFEKLVQNFLNRQAAMFPTQLGQHCSKILVVTKYFQNSFIMHTVLDYWIDDSLFQPLGVSKFSGRHCFSKIVIALITLALIQTESHFSNL